MTLCICLPLWDVTTRLPRRLEGGLAGFQMLFTTLRHRSCVLAGRPRYLQSLRPPPTRLVACRPADLVQPLPRPPPRAQSSAIQLHHLDLAARAVPGPRPVTKFLREAQIDKPPCRCRPWDPPGRPPSLCRREAWLVTALALSPPRDPPSWCRPPRRHRCWCEALLVKATALSPPVMPPGRCRHLRRQQRPPDPPHTRNLDPPRV